MKIYLDVCCLNRPFDDQTQDRIHLESEAILTILKHIEQHEWQWLSSDAVAYEINKTPNEERRERLWSLESHATKRIELTSKILKQGESIHKLGFTTYDSLHLAFASTSNVDAFLSTDDKLLKRASRYQEELKILVANPLTWMQEVLV